MFGISDLSSHAQKRTGKNSSRNPSAYRRANEVISYEGRIKKKFKRLHKYIDKILWYVVT